MPQRPPEPSLTLATVLDEQREAIVQQWLDLLHAADLDDAAEPLLRDHIPALLSDAAVLVASGERPNLTRVPDLHALQRIDLGVGLGRAVREYGLLREAIVLVAARSAHHLECRDLLSLDRLINHATQTLVEHYESIRDQTFAALDAVATAEAEATDLDQLLRALLGALAGAPSVVSAGLWIPEGDALVLRAVWSRGGAPEHSLSVPLDDPLIGAAFRAHRPVTGRPPSPRLSALVAAGQGLSAFEALPLMHGGQSVGVLHIASDTLATVWTHEERLFRALADRAASAVAASMAVATARAATERATQAESELRAFFAAAPFGAAIVDRDLRYVRVNEALARLNGHPVEDHLGRPIEEVIGSQNADVVRPALQRVLTTGEPMYNVLYHFGASALRITWFPILGDGGRTVALGGLLVDTTEQERAAAKLRETQTLLEVVVEQSGDGIVVADADGRLRFMNPAAAEQLGRGITDVQPEAWARTYELIDADGRILPAEQAPLYRALRLGQSLHGAVIRVRRPDGEVRELLGTATPLRDASGASLGAVVIMRDETERLAAEQEREALLRSEQRARTEADLALARANHAVASRERVMRVVSHDLKSPLSVISLSREQIQRALEHQRLERVPDKLAAIRRAVERMDALLRDLLDYEAIEAGAVAIRPVRSDPDDLLREACSLMQVIARDADVQLTALPGPPPPPVDCDPQRIVQVLTNLLANAVRVSPAGGRVALWSAEAERDGRRFALLAVRDAGPGIAPDFLPRIFEPFERATDVAYAGTGLGLPISRALVEAHGGHIEVDTRLGEGTTFRVWLPAAPG